MAKIIIINTEARLHLIGDFVSLQPGVNEVDAVVWREKCEPIKLVQHYIEHKVFVVRGPELGKLALPDALETVNACMDLSILDKWREQETRKQVLHAIAARKEELAKLFKQAENEREKKDR